METKDNDKAPRTEENTGNPKPPAEEEKPVHCGQWTGNQPPFGTEPNVLDK